MLVDSSVWIAASSPRKKECKQLKELLVNKGHQLCISQIIRLEVAQGARSKEQFNKLWNGFSSLVMLEVKESHWQMVAFNFMKCRSKGISISTNDCLIATLAQQYHVPLWSLDKIFQKVQPVLGLELN